MIALAPTADYAAFYLAEFRAVARTVYLVLYDREHAEDITQDAFVQLYLHWAKIARYDAPHAWVRRVAIRLAVRAAHRDRQRLQLTKLSADAPAAAPAPMDIDLLRATAALPARQRAAVALHYYEDRPVAEVADLLGCTTTATKVMLHRARQALAATLADRELDDAH
ncbi:sigma-70 family RNA polymerase sigma factor [Actinoplanes sp. CA-142083]|uniref:sigma-70 family RNA polymerase sigma factor n=1 Tax=Actinoplanes sp. CA-142083 TaxID=3239903 RepID=UPI003D89B960